MGFTRIFEKNGEKNCENWSENEFCILPPCPSTLTRLALWAELFQQKIQSTVAKADRREPTVRLLMVQLQLPVKEGTISYSIQFCMLYLLPEEAV